MLTNRDAVACNYCLGDPSSRKLGWCRQPYRQLISPEDDKIKDVEKRELKQHYLILSVVAWKSVWMYAEARGGPLLLRSLGTLGPR
ncbi:hypothetical protein E8E12_000574 [Didymella heteroderae]|uniref:Uncharacterized protein n=1 Tax=Didymella heteroderae TaxID=1769908 RepID=A0A9P4WFS4_9PLEO|nr:hypothetical protein E8E12_000574 [Didymella heteroderae]